MARYVIQVKYAGTIVQQGEVSFYGTPQAEKFEVDFAPRIENGGIIVTNDETESINALAGLQLEINETVEYEEEVDDDEYDPDLETYGEDA